ncbi:NAD(P)H-binding protein [Nesterenkonia xinjiangensis]|uniref:Uncharacterized protein YbjT (DUF2867 family) n=1 Tax=Nesterenkonia xinjiangensis TaxID=225327 RepID=A0A7Z0GMH5_9MICC|nr:NAD(P)H-binding protein [Nesterenkonia xinjiangensis]NYJ78701.1 uncharacterized protein YbjT (DUF2867 family) [Nesterenkonia xinjiangensis]
MSRYLITGATGNTGAPLVSELLRRGENVVAAHRRATSPADTAAVTFDWYDPSTHDRALEDVDAMYLVPPPLDPEPQTVMIPFLKLAREHGVRRVVLLGASIVPSGGPAIGQVHAALPELAIEWSVVRPTWFMQNFTGEHRHADSVREDGVITTATGEGKVGFVDVRDIAAVAAVALVSSAPPPEDLVVTGPETLSFSDVASLLSTTLDRTVSHRPLTPSRLIDHLGDSTPAAAATVFAQLDSLIATGAEDYTKTTVQDLTGRPPRTLQDLLREVNT